MSISCLTTPMAITLWALASVTPNEPKPSGLPLPNDEIEPDEPCSLILASISPYRSIHEALMTAHYRLQST